MNLVCAGTVTQNSDRQLKEDIRDADIQSITSVFDSVTYGLTSVMITKRPERGSDLLAKM